ncbi:MAG TPA: hypothetical protein VGC96_14020 [Candidatus Elarobacter sp.]
MHSRVHMTSARVVAIAAAAVFLTGCPPQPNPPPPPSSPVHLYVGNGAATGGVRQYNLPISAGSLPNFTIATAPQVTALAVNPGELAVGRTGGQITFFPPPLSGSSSPSLTFPNGPAIEVRQIFFDGNAMFATTRANYVNRFSAPFGTSPPVAITDPLLDESYGVVRDVAGVLYVSNQVADPLVKSNVVRIPPSGPSIATAPQLGCVYGHVVLAPAAVVVACDNAPLLGRVDVYPLALAAGAAPAFSITNAVDTPVALALDASGNLYVGNAGNSTVTVYQPPFSAASTAAVTLPVPSYQVRSLAIGP